MDTQEILPFYVLPDQMFVHLRVVIALLPFLTDGMAHMGL